MLYLVSLVGGMIFGLGLAVSRMINPAKVLNFLDVAGQWDPSLALVFLAAIAIALPLHQWALRNHSSPLAAEEFRLPEASAITPSLIGGSAIFGVGWGLAGLCPGPGLAALASLLPGVIAFVGAMFLGIASYRLLTSRPSEK